MSQDPTKSYWYGQDINELPRETLLEIIDYLNRRVEETRSAMHSVIEINELARKARARIR